MEQPVQNYERCIKNIDELWLGQLDGEEEENSKMFWFPVEEIQTVFNAYRTRFDIIITIIIPLLLLLLLLFDIILLARSLR